MKIEMPGVGRPLLGPAKIFWVQSEVYQLPFAVLSLNAS